MGGQRIAAAPRAALPGNGASAHVGLSSSHCARACQCSRLSSSPLASGARPVSLLMRTRPYKAYAAWRAEHRELSAPAILITFDYHTVTVEVAKNMSARKFPRNGDSAMPMSSFVLKCRGPLGRYWGTEVRVTQGRQRENKSNLGIGPSSACGRPGCRPGPPAGWSPSEGVSKR